MAEVIPCDATEGIAVVAVRTSSVAGAGHVGVAFQNADGTWTCGAIEGPRNPGTEAIFDVNPGTYNGAWVQHLNSIEDVEKEFASIRPSSDPTPHAAYDTIKILQVANPNPTSADITINDFKNRGYNLLYYNCLTAVNDVLKAYGAEKLPSAFDNIQGVSTAPNSYFNKLPGTGTSLKRLLSDADVTGTQIKEASATSRGPEPVSPSYTGSNSIGERVAVAATQGLNVRSEPGTSYQIIIAKAQGSTGAITDGPTFQDGYWWWQVNFDDGTTGWSIDDYLVQAVQPNPEPVTPSYTGPISMGERVAVAAAATQGLNVRSVPGTSSQVIIVEAQGSTGTIKDGPTFQDSYWWWQVNFDDGTSGWCADNWLVQSVRPQQPIVPTPYICAGSARLACGLNAQQQEAIAALDPVKDKEAIAKMKQGFYEDITNPINNNHQLRDLVCLNPDYVESCGCDLEMLKESDIDCTGIHDSWTSPAYCCGKN